MICNVNSTLFNINDDIHRKEIDTILATIRNKLSKIENISNETLKSLILKIFDNVNGLGLSFSLNPNVSSKIDSYNASVDDFINTFCELLKSKNEDSSVLYNHPRKGRIDNIPILTSNDINEIKKELNSRFKSKQLTKIERHIQDKISETEFIKGEMIRLGEIHSEEYKDVQTLIFSDNQLANQDRLSDFRKQLIGFTIINNVKSSNSKGYVVDSDYFINKSIINYLNEQYRTLYEFLKSIELIDDSTEIAKNLYYLEKLVHNSKNLLLIMLNYLNSTRFDHNTLTRDWLKFKSDPNDNSANLYRAVNAYLQIMHFDDIIQEVFDGFILIDDSLSEIIETRMNNDQPTTVLKYSLSRKNTNQTNHWGDIDSNSLKTLGNYSTILINSIPIVNHITKKSQTDVLQPKDLLGSVSKLLEIGHLIKYDNAYDGVLNNLKELILNIHEDTPRKFKLIFDIIFSGKADKINYVLSYLRINHNIDQIAFNYLYSFYLTVFEGTEKTNSWYNIENDYIRKNGVLSRYNTVDTLCYALTSNVVMNYLLTKYDFDEGETKTTIKPKFNIDSRVFDIRNHINQLTINRANKKELIETYLPDPAKIGFKDPNNSNVVLIKIGNNRYNINFGKKGVFEKLSNIVKITSDSGKEIFSSDQNKNSSFARIFKKFNFDLIQEYFFNKEKLISDINTLNPESKTNNSDLETLLEFINVVLFIDDIFGFRFSKTTEGLKELLSFLFNNSQSAQNFKNMFGSAVRSLIISKIYYDFESLVDENGKRLFSKTQFVDFIEKYENNELSSYGLIGNWVGFNLNDKVLKKRYTFERIDGTHLTTVISGESWIRALSRTRAELEGDTSKSVIKNFSNDNIPNLSLSFLGAKIETQINKQGDTSALHLLFYGKLKNIVSKCIDTDVMSFTGQKKSIKDLTYSDLIYNSVVNNFIVPLNSGTVCYFQPTVYSDKTKIVLYGIELQGLLNNDTFKRDDLFTDAFNTIIENKIIDTIGKSYKAVWDTVVDDYKKIFYKDFDLFDSDGTLNISKVQNWLKTHSLKDLLKKINEYNTTYNENIVIYLDVHYRKINKGLSINELLWEYSQNLYSREILHNRLEREKVNFINELLGLRFNILLDIDDHGNLNTATGNETTKLLGRIKGINNNPWVLNKRMILGKIYKVNEKGTKILSKNVVYGRVTLAKDEVFELNPILNAYFMLDNLIGNNLRLILTGSEINHKIKPITKDLGEYAVETIKDEFSGEVKKITLNSYRDLISLLNPYYSKGSLITFYDLDQAIKAYNNLPEILHDGRHKSEIYNINPLIKAYELLIYLMENAALNAQFKRNVTIPGTIRHYSNNELNNIGKEMKIAVIEDVRAEVFNFDGVLDKIDAHDGSAWVNPFWSILENYSLQDNEVGTVKKPIHHYYDGRFADATLLKYAVNTITNRLMLRSEGNSSNLIKLKDIFKKMTNQKWDSSIDLTKLGLNSEKDISNFNKIILEKERLFYKDGDIHYEIVDFNKDSDLNFYYTEELLVDFKGISFDEGIRKIFHLFDSNSNHIKVSKSQLDQLIKSGEIEKYHTIQSLYELHTVMGGIYSESLDSSNNLLFSEKSNYAVVLFMNNVVQLKDKNNTELNLKNYHQPLKYLAIDMIANQTAVKNGAGNINPTTSFYNEEPLTYMTLNTDFYGIQMNSDHEADEAHMTEFSQVISSLDAQGYLHKYVREIYDSLGSVALQLANIELEAVEEYRKTNDISKLYDVVARTIINNLNQNKGESGLAQEILNVIERELNLNTNHKKDKHHIPFSDKTIYSTILSTFVSVLNKKSIKRLYPGLGTVICPGYDMATVHELNIDGKNQTLMYEDLIRHAYLYFRKNKNLSMLDGITDVSLKNRTIVQLFLYEKLKEMPVISLNDLDPTDNVFILITNGERFLIENLDTSKVEYEITHHEWKDDQGVSHLNPVLKIYLKGQKHKGSFDLVKDIELGFYSVHFKTGDADKKTTYGSTKEERNILYENLYKAIPWGAKVSTYGFVSEGGIYALDKLMSVYIGDSKLDNTLKDNSGSSVYRNVKDRDGNDIQIPIYIKTSGMDSGEYYLNFELHESLSKIDDYYNFKLNILEYLLQKGYIVSNGNDIILLKDVTRPRNLAPQKLRFSYYDGQELVSINIFDHWRLKKLHNETKKILKSKLSKEEKSKLLKDLYLKCDPLRAFLELSSSTPKYILEDGTELEVNKESIINVPAEIIMSNIYKSRFLIENGVSLNLILNAGSSYFSTKLTLIESDNYDMAFTKFNGKHLYITFKPLNTDSDNIDSSKRKWRTIPVDFLYPEDYSGEKKIILSIYAVTKDNIKLFEVGRKIIVDDIRYDNKLRRYVSDVKDKQGKINTIIVKNQNLYSLYVNDEGKTVVLLYIEFLSKYEVSEYGDINKKYTLYNINKKNLLLVSYKIDYTEELLSDISKKRNKTTPITKQLKQEEDISYFISNLLSQVYKSDDFSGVLFNKQLSETSHFIINNSLYNFAEKVSYNPSLSEYLHNVKTKINSLEKNKETNKYEYKLGPNLLKYYRKVSLDTYASFTKSLYFTASRIPAQTLQSFMQMKCVGFTGTNDNHCFVSHWQTWLQGSDYDIDKAYIMGFSFDGTGRYIGWSDLFDYSSTEMLKISEKLPMPKNKTYEFNKNGIDITSYVDRLFVENISRENRLKILNELIHFLNENEELSKSIVNNRIKYLFYFNLSENIPLEKKDNELRNRINTLIYYLHTHEKTKLPPSLIELANKNFISTRIQQVVSNPVNMIHAYSPILMEDLREASLDTPKGRQSAKSTLLNPATKALMLFLNMSGKAVIGIAANGEKVSFMWHHYLNHVVHSVNDKILDARNKGIEYNIEEDEDLKRARFSFVVDRVKGRKSNNITSIEINTLPDVNLDKIDNELVLRLGNKLTGNIKVDLMISLILSAATDNAKELILDKINSGNKLAKMYLFMITLGLDIEDIVLFMTSPVISFIDSLSNDSIYSRTYSVKNAIAFAKGDFSSLFSTNILNIIKNYFEENEAKDIIDQLKKGSLKTKTGESILDKLKNMNISLYYKLELLENVIQLLEILLSRDFKEFDEKDVIADINSFEKILKGATEFTNFSKLLGMNLGLKTDKVSLLLFVESIENIFNEGRESTKLEFDNNNSFNLKRFFIDPEYAEKIIDDYEERKICVNIFDAILKLPHFKAIGELLSLVIDVSHITARSKIYDIVSHKVRNEMGIHLTDNFRNNTINAISNVFIANFLLNNLNIKVPYPKGTEVLTALQKKSISSQDGLFDFSSMEQIASFKYYFENVLIPKLQQGLYYTFENGNVVLKSDDDIKRNNFIQSLITGFDKNTPLYKCDLNMLTFNNTSFSFAKFLSYSKGLVELKNIKIRFGDNNDDVTTLLELFIIYNLIVNKNLYGSDRLTTLFKNVVLNNENLSILNKYFDYIGELDYNELEFEKLKIDINLILIDAAPIVSTTVKLKEPVIKIKNKIGGLDLFVRDKFGNYSRFENFELIPIIEGESEEDFIERNIINQLYFTLGGVFTSNINNIIESLDTNDILLLSNTFFELTKKGILLITLQCE